jgi:AbrB family looped-hinge helix DNA binding protein
MQSRVSVRGQTVIPKDIRKAFNITPDKILQWEVTNGRIVVFPVPADPVRASVGILKGKWNFAEFLKEREADRVVERTNDRTD